MLLTTKGKIVFLFTLGLLLALGIAEVGLRCAGIQPGKLYTSRWFHEVDTLRAVKGFMADSNGIFRVSNEARVWIDSVIDAEKDNVKYTTNRQVEADLAHEVYSLNFEYLQLIHGQVSNPLAKYVVQIKTKIGISESDNVILNYIHHPVNEDGFRSIAFLPYNSQKKKILLIGDSFTWGHSALDITNSFADHLLARGYVVYNAGISGADAAQYLALAEKLIPKLKPDYVVVNFYLGNDVIYFDRKPEPFIPIFYSTNAGNLISSPQHRYFYTAEEAYRFTIESTYVPKSTFLGRLSYRSALVTLPYSVAAKFGFSFTYPAGYTTYYEEVAKAKLNVPAANDQIASLERIAKSNGAKFAVTIIPSINRFGRFTHPDDFSGLFTHQLYFYPTSLTFDHYNPEDGHFNDLAQPVYADFIEKVIKVLK
jgi:lysophospholipase L1-like esterase